MGVSIDTLLAVHEARRREKAARRQLADAYVDALLERAALRLALQRVTLALAAVPARLLPDVVLEAANEAERTLAMVEGGEDA